MDFFVKCPTSLCNQPKFCFQTKSKSLKVAIGNIPTAAFAFFAEKSRRNKNKRSCMVYTAVNFVKIVKKNRDASLSWMGFLEKTDQKE